MKMYIIAAALVSIIGAALYIRYTKYKTWNKFLDDAFEQLTFDFLPGPVRILLVMVLVVWGGSSLISYFTRDLKFKEPGAQPAAAPLNQLANASQLPAMPPPPPTAGAGEQQGGGGGNPPPASQLTPEQTAALMDQLKQISIPQQPAAAASAEQQAESKKDEATKAENLLAKLPGMPKPEAENQKESNSQKEKGAAAAKKPDARVLPSQSSAAALQPNMLVLQAAAPAVRAASAPVFSTAAERAANADASKRAAQQAKVAAAQTEQYDKFIKDYDLVVKSKGTCFDARLIQEGMNKSAFLRPCGDIVSIPTSRVAKIIKGARKYPLELDPE